MKLNLNISNKAVVFAFFLLLMGATVFYAQARIFTYNRIVSQGEAFGHGADELVVRMSDGTFKTVQELLTNGVGAAPAPAAAGWTLIGELSDPAGTTNLQSVSFNLASQSDVLLVVYANVNVIQGQSSILSFKADGVEVDKADIAGGTEIIGGSILSVATLSHRMTLASGAHTLRLDFPYPGFFGYGPRGGGNKPRFYVYQLTGGSGSGGSLKQVSFSSSTTWNIPSGVTSFVVELIGAGGAGGTGSPLYSSGCGGGGYPPGGGGGGGGGAYGKKFINVPSGVSTVSIQIGAPGSSTSVSISGLPVLSVGSGGNGVSPPNGSAGAGGADGNSSNPSVFDVYKLGTAGIAGEGLSCVRGCNAGLYSGPGKGGNGAPSFFSSVIALGGGNGVSNFYCSAGGYTGQSASVPGAGGAGGSGYSGAGGAGAAGKVVITYVG